MDDHLVQQLRDGSAGKLSDVQLAETMGLEIERFRRAGNLTASAGSEEWRSIARALCAAELEALGPLFHNVKDCELPGVLVEVKARRGAAHPKITISSEAQLSPVDGFKFFLRVIDVDTALASTGQTLADHVDPTAALFAEDPEALDLREERPAATGYDLDDIDERRTWRTGRSRT
ncbi:PD-(D/E)XK motif protein [Falsirhodobacter sp. 20TX0035]|uniref:PD-(D/E)XK motif protein n=1 Tax=Falsirhodobacter sp. 20TX0035 TaxID=3022019 RepID=UPI00232FD03F|nr:PD-(D/E)XK motif protein [Falsirhodobacter sp. 20TX0035]MDB6453635.1 PD-(D/E)XK motif protein [Falsirhodobacter sp. 20TX0035]